jgi:glucose-1-phosphate thymidylyltransferase
VGKFLGIVFAGGRGTRLDPITRYISKAFVPAYDRPVFLYPLGQLQASSRIDEIVILTNRDNDTAMKKAGHRTVVQDDERVHDMWSGLRYLREAIDNDRDAVLIPCDNVSDISIDDVIETFSSGDFDVAFSVMPVADSNKLRQMGVYDVASRRVCYKPSVPPSNLGVVAPYVIRGGFDPGPVSEAEAFNRGRIVCREYHGPWFDVGDPDALLACSSYLQEHSKGE